MNLARNVTGSIALGLAVIAGPAVAQDKGWDGTWVGTTERGGSIQVSISGGSPRAYVFRGTQVPIGGVSVRGSTMTLSVAGNGGSAGTVTLARRGADLGYTYSDTAGGKAAATLQRQ